MNWTNRISKVALVGVLTVFCETSVVADDTKRDNSRVNARDGSITELTAQDQSTARTDMEITRKIRKDITDRAGLSTYARNVKIIANSGRVTLKGPVHTQAEKNTVVNIATRVAGVSGVSNELEIVPME